jgi:phosphonate transport system substrate-binding protein
MADHTERRSFSLGVLPYLIPRHMAKTYGPATANISRETGLNIHLRTTSNFPNFLANLKAQQYDFVIVQPFDVILAVDELNYRPLARISIQLDSILVVPTDSPLKTLQDLKGKVLAMAPKPAATSRMGRTMLQDAGLKLDHDIKIKYLNSHDSCLQEVLNQRADACMTGPPPLKLFEARTGIKMRVLATAPPIPHIALLAHSRVDDDTAKAVQQAVLSWKDTPEGKKIMKKMAFPGWIPADIEDYTDVRRILASDKHLQNNTAKQGSHYGNDYIFGAFPYFPPKRLAHQLAPIPLAFSKALGKTVHFRTTTSFNSFMDNLEASLYDIVLIQPFDYQRAIKSGYLPLAQLDGRIAATFYVTKDSTLKNLQSLLGKTVAMPPAETAVSRLGIMYLNKHNLIHGENITIQYRRSHDSCINQLLNKQVAACASTYQVLQMMPDKMAHVRILDKSPSIPSVLLMAHHNLSQTQRDTLKQTILSWKNTTEGQEILQAMHYDAFVPFVKRDYQSMFAQ